MHRFQIAAIAFCCAGLTGCSTFHSSRLEIPTGRSDYRLFFTQRHHPEFPRQAYYTVVHRGHEQPLGTFASRIKVDERGVDDRQMKVGRDFRPQAVFSPSGQTLLITENCWDAVPDFGYLLVRLRDGRPTEPTYLQMPTRPLIPYGDHPDVLSVDEQTVKVRYLSGERKFSFRELQPGMPWIKAP